MLLKLGEYLLAGTSLLFYVFDANIVSFSEKNRATINLLCCGLGCHAISLGAGFVCHELDIYLKRVALRHLWSDQHVRGDPGFFKGGQLVPQGRRINDGTCS